MMEAIERMKQLEEDNRRMREACLTADELVSYMLSVRRSNTPEWMEGMASAINQWAESVGEEDRVATSADGLQVITPEDTSETRYDHDA